MPGGGSIEKERTDCSEPIEALCTKEPCEGLWPSDEVEARCALRKRHCEPTSAAIHEGFAASNPSGTAPW